MADLQVWQKWQVQVQDWRDQLGCKGELEVLRPWTSQPGRRYLGLKPSPRVLAILDLVTIEVLGGADATVRIMQGEPEHFMPKIEDAMSDIIVDLSQNPIRRAFTNSRGISKCMTTASQLYAFRRDGLILSQEQMLFQGHSRKEKYPPSMSQRAIHDLAGVGISLPSLGAIFASMLVTTGL